MVTAIFILVVLAMLGAFIATISSQNQVGAALDVQGARAYQAARAGIEWSLYQVLQGTPAAPPNTTTCSSTVPTPTIVVDGMTVTVCLKRKADSSVEIGLVSIWEVTAWACNQPGALGTCPGNVAGLGYVERKITTLVEHP